MAKLTGIRIVTTNDGENDRHELRLDWDNDRHQAIHLASLHSEHVQECLFEAAVALDSEIDAKEI